MFTSSAEIPTFSAIWRESNLPSSSEYAFKIAEPVQRMVAAIRPIDFQVMGRFPRSSCDKVECSTFTERANARSE